MTKGFFAYRLFPVLMLLGLMTLPLGAQEEVRETPEEESQAFSRKINWFAEVSILFFPENNGMASDPMPVLPSPGAGVSFSLTRFFGLELTLDFYMTHYGYDYTLDRAVPYAIENRSSRVMGALFGFQAAAYFNVKSFITIRVYGGPAADLRIVFMAADLNSGDKDQAKKETDSVRKYFWSSGRWLMPVVGAGIDFSIKERFKVGLDLRIWAPIYRLWSGENLPGIEGWRFSPGIRVTF